MAHRTAISQTNFALFLCFVVVGAVNQERDFLWDDDLVTNEVPDNITAERLYPTPYADSPLLPMLLQSLSMQKHAPHATTYIKAEYDYIIVGSGSAGSVLASRLSEVPCISVLLLEAGKLPPRLTEIPGIARSFVGSDIDWNYVTVPQKHTGSGLNNRQLPFPSGKVLGGSSIWNAMLFVRGNSADYDKWAGNGAVGWSYREVLPYFQRLEDNRDLGFIEPGYHGVYGPVTVQQPHYSPALKRALLASAQSLGYPVRDVNGRFQRGFFDFQATIRDGQRCSAAKAYLVPTEQRENLDIVVNAFVTKVVSANRQAKAVQFDLGGQRYEVQARREVILSAGTINSAKLLMLSGIGPKEHLDKLNIPMVADLPVGLNLQDHPASIQGYQVTERLRPYIHKLSDPSNIQRYIDNRTGPLTSAEGVATFAFLTNDRRAPAEAIPDHQIYFAEAVSLIAKLQANVKQDVYQRVFGPYENATTYWCVSQILHPKSRGTVTLKSADPYDPPNIDPNYFADPQDVKDMVEGMKQCNEVSAAGPMKRLEARPFETSYPDCEQFSKDTEEYLSCQVSSVVITLSHQVGTVKMGHPSDQTTVVDTKLRVKGVKGLRVVDASVMPTVPSGNTNIPTMMIAEKASDMIRNRLRCEVWPVVAHPSIKQSITQI